MFLQVKPLMLHFTRQFWTDYCSVFSRFAQSCTWLENGWCSKIMPLHTVWSVCTNSWLRNGSCAWSPSLQPWFGSCGRFPVSLLEGGHQWWMFCGNECHQRSCDSCSAIDSTGGLYWLFPEAVQMLSNVCCSGWRLFWRAIKKIYLYLLFCLFSDRIHWTF